MQVAKELLKKYFGYDEFRKGQEEIIRNILSKRDVLGIMPTGGGKSICYQIPALIFEGVTIVISPLISLMKDQVDSLNIVGIKSAFINSTLSNMELREIVNNIRNNIYKIIYVAPERLENEGFIEFINKINISQIAIDEAHCISHWGHDFRKSYTKIKAFIDSFTNRPIITAFTATATEDVKKDIITQLGLRSPSITVTGFDRENLKLIIVRNATKQKFILSYIEENKNVSGIIYCATRKETDELYTVLSKIGYSVGKYHAGMGEKQRKKSQEEFLYDNISIMVATNAFGMGIDKSNIRYVIHHSMPKNLEAYYQEVGRAGRDGEKSECVLLFNKQDIILQKYFIEELGDSSEAVKQNKYEQLQRIIDYSYTTNCLRKQVLSYFGQEYAQEKCDNCSNCNDYLEKQDITIEAQKILSCVHRMKERFGTTMVTKVLKGSASQPACLYRDLSTYGIMREYSVNDIKEYMNVLIADGYLKMGGDKYPIIKLTEKSIKILKENEKVYIQTMKHREISGNEGLFEILRQLRKTISIEERLPPFVVFSDATLKEMSGRYPISKEQILNISGVGEAKYERYGKKFINEIQIYVDNNNIDTSKIVYEEKTTNNRMPRERRVGETCEKTLELMRELGSIPAVAKRRELATTTIETHLADAYKWGLYDEAEEYLNQQDEQQILEAIKSVGTEKLRPIKDLVSEDISYFMIKLVIAKHEKNGG
ncbi:MAG: ATP-dependent DNA helicase RecQ [Clostridiales bacterium GWE2_32_10]|nr:MAG: ATP-dependent DNA helicase RecQ [Clostridiales bacterium GWE2_32_10]HBY21619.1 DNA helicase RecQ [Clostridiales bacterium]